MQNKKSKIEITIGIPLYKGDRRFHLAITSAISQSDYVKNIIISDDGDNEIICKYYQKIDKRIKYVRNVPAKGMWSNFVHIYKLCTTRYFCWLGDDDFLSPSYSITCVNAIIKNPGASAYTGIPNSHTQTRGTSIVTRNFFPKSEHNATYSIYDQTMDIFTYFGWGSLFYSLFDISIIKIDTFEKFLDWPLEKYSFDYAFMMQVASSGKVVVIPELIYFYDQTNWIENEKKPKDYENINVPLIYLLWYLDFLTDEKKSKINRKEIILVLKMLFSKYLLRKMGNNIGKMNITLKQYLIYSTELIYNKRKEKEILVKYINRILQKCEIDEELNKIINTKCRDFFDLVWYKFPDLYLYKRKIISIIKHLFSGKLKINTNNY